MASEAATRAASEGGGFGISDTRKLLIEKLVDTRLHMPRPCAVH